MKELAPGHTDSQSRLQASGPQTHLANPQTASIRSVVQSFPDIAGRQQPRETSGWRPQHSFIYRAALSYFFFRSHGEGGPGRVNTDTVLAGRAGVCWWQARGLGPTTQPPHSTPVPSVSVGRCARPAAVGSTSPPSGHMSLMLTSSHSGCNTLEIGMCFS